MNCRYVIFDMDGTLVDSVPYWRNLGREYLTAKGAHPTDQQLARVIPMTMEKSSRYFHELFLPDKDSRQIMKEMNDLMEEHYRKDIALKPGVMMYLEKISRSGAHMCVATATDERLARDCLARLGVLGMFSFIASCETIGKSKREPDIYHLAARRLLSESGLEEDMENPAWEMRIRGPKDAQKDAGMESVTVTDSTRRKVAVFEDYYECARTAHNAGYYTVGIYESEYREYWGQMQAICDETYLSWAQALESMSGK